MNYVSPKFPHDLPHEVFLYYLANGEECAGQSDRGLLFDADSPYFSPDPLQKFDGVPEL